VREGVLDELLALLQGEQRLTLLRVPHRRDDDAVEQARRGLDDLDVPVVDRVERPGVQHHRHERSSAAVWPCSSRSDFSMMRTTLPPYRRDLRTRHPSGGSTSRSDSTTAVHAGRASSSSCHPSKAYGGSRNTRSASIPPRRTCSTASARTTLARSA